MEALFILAGVVVALALAGLIIAFNSNGDAPDAREYMPIGEAMTDVEAPPEPHVPAVLETTLQEEANIGTQPVVEAIEDTNKAVDEDLPEKKKSTSLMGQVRRSKSIKKLGNALGGIMGN